MFHCVCSGKADSISCIYNRIKKHWSYIQLSSPETTLCKLLRTSSWRSGRNLPSLSEACQQGYLTRHWRAVLDCAKTELSQKDIVHQDHGNYKQLSTMTVFMSPTCPTCPPPTKTEIHRNNLGIRNNQKSPVSWFLSIISCYIKTKDICIPIMRLRERRVRTRKWRKQILTTKCTKDQLIFFML